MIRAAFTLAVYLLAAYGATVEAATPSALLETGRRLYEDGVTASTQPLVGFSTGGVELAGPRAACAQCHRRSGSGSLEGGTRIPPIDAPALFSPPDPANTYQPRLPAGSTVTHFRELNRAPYDSATLARVLREGIDAAGNRLQPLMPRYALAPDDFAALEAYLRQLSLTPSPGVEGKTLQVTTVLTPGATLATRQTVVEVLQACLAERLPESSTGGFRARLRVVELAGEPGIWFEQLASAQESQPAYAFLAGAGGTDWAPVQAFCETEGLPCLFPSVDVPGQRRPTRNTFYFSAGTVLEGEVMAHWLAQRRPAGKPTRVVVLRASDDDAAKAGVAALAHALSGNYRLEERPLAVVDGTSLRLATADIGEADVLSLWLRPPALQSLAESMPKLPQAETVIASGWLGAGWLLAAPPGWRSHLHFTWALDTPFRLERRLSVNLRPWLADKNLKIARTEERAAGDALTACNLFVESVARQKGALTRYKLVEQIENYPVVMGNAMAPEAYYRFSLGPGQRFSSKGAFVVRFAAPDWRRLEPEGDWVTP